MPVFEPETTGFDPTRVHCRASLANQASAFALLLGMGSVTTTSDTIPAVLIGGPGTAGGSGHGAGRARTAKRR